MEKFLQKFDELYKELVSEKETIDGLVQKNKDLNASLRGKKKQLDEVESALKEREKEVQKIENILDEKKAIQALSIKVAQEKAQFKKEQVESEYKVKQALASIAEKEKEIEVMRDVFKKKDAALSEKEATLRDEKENLRKKILEEIGKKFK